MGVAKQAEGQSAENLFIKSDTHQFLFFHG